jgi:dihydrolipoamide dehydrogenase
MTMNELHVDVAIIGAGTAGLAAYRAAVAEGKTALLIEGGPYGTTCARVGCMPSKLLIAAAEMVYHAQHAAPFGVTATVSIDRREVMARVRRERDRFVGMVVDGVEKLPEAAKLVGWATFDGPHRLNVKALPGGKDVDTTVHARTVVLASGSSPVVPPILKDIGDRLVVNDHVFDWDELPESIAVFGTGVIGLELGQAMHRLGARVRMFGRGGSLGGISDPAVRKRALEIFAAEMPINPDADVKKVERVGEMVEITFVENGKTLTESFHCVLAAAGRKANLSNLGLETTGIKIDERGVPVFDRRTLQCGDSSIFIGGDASSDVPLLHEAADEGKIAGANAATFATDGKVAPGHRRSKLAIVFTDPNLAACGRTYAEVSHRSDVVIGEVDFADQGRSRVMLQNRGLLRVYAEKGTGRFLGAEMAAPRGEHMAHLLAWSHQARLTIEQMLEMPFYHPVVEEGLRTALRDAAAKLAAASVTPSAVHDEVVAEA